MFHYVLLGFVIALPIGAISIEMTKQGLINGFIYAWMIGIGAMIVDIFLLITLNLGLSDVLEQFKNYLWLLGACFLTHLAWQNFKETPTLKKSVIEIEKPSLIKIFKTGLMIGINPGNIVFWLSVLGTSIVGASSTAEISLFMVSVSILLGIIAHDVLLSFIVSRFNRFVTPKANRYISVIAGISLLVFAFQFASEWFVNAEVIETVMDLLS